MPDIFLSYNREDQATARRFAEAFQAEGFDVWWDTTLRAGEAYDEVTENALNQAKAVVVLWSPRSVISRWVRAEATQADRNKTLVPVTIEECRRPIMFELTQTAELSHWEGDVRDKAWQAFLADVKRFVQAGAAIPKSAPAPPSAMPTQVSIPAPGRVSICVLPFANMSRDEDQEYFADGISEDIITDLSKVSAVHIISRNTAFTFKGRPVDVKQVASQLGVTHVLEGSVRRAGNRVRITAQLIDGRVDGHVWADRWDRDLDDIFALQDEISEAIVKALKLKLFPEEKKAIQDRGTDNVEAYDIYLRARALANAPSSTDLFRALDLYRQALAVDPGFAPARGGMALIYELMPIYAPEAREETLEAVDALARDALARAPDHWASRLANGMRLAAGRDWLGALAAFEQALALAPPSETGVVILLTRALSAVGRTKDAIRVLETARKADPLSMIVSIGLQQTYYSDGRTEDARAEYERTQDLSGGAESREHHTLFRVWDFDDEQRTKAQFQRYLASRTMPMPVLVKVMEAFDQPLAALALLRHALDDPANHDGMRLAVLACYAALFGDGELAVSALRRSAIDYAGGLFAIWYPLLSGARRTPAFKQLVRDLGVYDYWRTSGNWGDFARPLGDDDFEIIR